MVAPKTIVGSRTFYYCSLLRMCLLVAVTRKYLRWPWSRGALLADSSPPTQHPQITGVTSQSVETGCVELEYFQILLGELQMYFC